MTRYAYNSITSRIQRQRSEKYIKSGWTYTSNGSVQQDTAHSYDLIGNIIELNEKTTGCGVGGTNSLTRNFGYDPLYRALNGTGRENAPTITPIWDDRYRSTDDSTTTGYTQNYSYDKLGNIQELQHIGNSNFTRIFNYGTSNNQLLSIDIGMTNYAFSYDACGNQLTETTSRYFEWDFGNRLKSFFVQTGTSEPTQYAQYLYDAGGTRVKKIVRTSGGAYTSRVYIDDAFEYFTDGTDEQNLLHIMDDQMRVAMVRLGNAFSDTTPAIKYNLDDYLGNSTLLLETSGASINKEEYYPFGETSFGSYTKKRYKFSGKERDEESGLYYCKFRYHSAWTCRFISVDPLAPKYPHYCSYSYAGNKVVTFVEFEGLEEIYSADGSFLDQFGTSTSKIVVSNKAWEDYQNIRNDTPIKEDQDTAGFWKNKAEAKNHLIENGTKIVTQDKIWGSLISTGKSYIDGGNLQQEYGFVVFKRYFKDKSGNEFVGYVPGSIVEGTVADAHGNAHVDPIRSSLQISGNYAKYGSSISEGFVRAFMVHVHPLNYNSTDEFSPSDYGLALEHNLNSYLYSRDTRMMYKFTPAKYKLNTDTEFVRPPLGAYNLSPKTTFDQDALKDATTTHRIFED